MYISILNIKLIYLCILDINKTIVKKIKKKTLIKHGKKMLLGAVTDW